MGDFSTKMIGYFKQAIDLYKASMLTKFSHTSEDPWVLFVVESVERNVIDQKIIESELQRVHGIKSMRLSFAEIAELKQVDPHTNIITVRGKEIGFVYYRAGYQVE
jgi:hypothetical protein